MSESCPHRHTHKPFTAGHEHDLVLSPPISFFYFEEHTFNLCKQNYCNIKIKEWIPIFYLDSYRLPIDWFPPRLPLGGHRDQPLVLFSTWYLKDSNKIATWMEKCLMSLKKSGQFYLLIKFKWLVRTNKSRWRHHVACLPPGPAWWFEGCYDG